MIPVGVPFRLGSAYIVATYARKSEAPRADGACVTADYADPEAFEPAGWYIEFHYIGDTETYRRFVPFGADYSSSVDVTALPTTTTQEGQQ